MHTQPVCERAFVGLLPDSKRMGCTCVVNAGNVPPPPPPPPPTTTTTTTTTTTPTNHHHHHPVVSWCMVGTLTPVAGETFPVFSAHAQPTTLGIWQEAYCVVGWSLGSSGLNHGHHQRKKNGRLWIAQSKLNNTCVHPWSNWCSYSILPSKVEPCVDMLF